MLRLSLLRRKELGRRKRIEKGKDVDELMDSFFKIVDRSFIEVHSLTGLN